MYTYNNYKNFFTFYRKIYNYIKKIYSPNNYNFFFLTNIKMDQNNITSFESDDKSYRIIDLYLNSRFLGYKDSYNYYDINVDKILLFKKSDNEYVIRYNDINKMMIVPLQLKINNSYNERNAFKKIIKSCIFIMMIKNFLENV